jgi:hypothetical protein
MKIAIVSTGNAAKDLLLLEKATLHQNRMDANICPNGCGEMIWDDAHSRHCPSCKFVGWSNAARKEP